MLLSSYGSGLSPSKHTLNLILTVIGGFNEGVASFHVPV